jgi:methionyl-tRNA synthetase
MEKKKFYLTTAIAYASGTPHIGNTYEAIMADSVARYKRLQGFDVFFQTGTDEHGLKIEEKAAAKGMKPKEFVDQVSDDIKRIWKRVNVSYDKFIRTTDADHEKQIQKMFKKFYDQGDIYKSEYEGMYCTPCESFWTPSQLVDGKCPDCGREVKPAKEESYFFKMSKYAPQLIDYINEHPDFIQPESRKNEIMNNFLLPGLQDLCISRTSFKWGIPVDFDPKHVVYVWLDALANYITGIGYDVDGNHSELYRKMWPADVHIIGKDIIRFHAIYWPIFLMALGQPLYKHLFAHPWFIQSGEKMSKSKGNVLYAEDLCDVYGTDAVRYFVLHEMPYGNDGSISWDLLTEKTNSDLANTMGNLVNRTIAMSNKYFGGEVINAMVCEDVDDDLKAVATGAYAKFCAKMDTYRISDAIDEVFNIYKRCNKYIDETAPWTLAKDPEKQGRLQTVLYNLIEAISIATTMVEPFMPETANKVFEQLNVEKRDFNDLDKFGLIPSGIKVTDKPEILFARLDPKEIAVKAEEIRKAQAEAYARENGEVPAEEKAEEKTDAVKLEMKPEITFDDFGKMQFAVGKILKCEAVPKSKKLLCSQVQIGDTVKQIVSGIRQYYTPEEMVGKEVMVLVNLKPATLAGVLSEGMLLCAESPDGKLTLMKPEASMPSGSVIC